MLPRGDRRYSRAVDRRCRRVSGRFDLEADGHFVMSVKVLATDSFWHRGRVVAPGETNDATVYEVGDLATS